MLVFTEAAHQYQKDLVNYLVKNPKSGVFLDMGMGKTAICLYTFKWLKEKGLVDRALIIAPKYVALYTWGSEIKLWEDFKDLTINIAVGNENTRFDAFEKPSDIVVINRDMVSWMMKSVSMKSFQVLIIDELSSFKNPNSNRFRALAKIRHNFKYIWGLTGTPAPNTLMDLFSQAYLIEPEMFGYNFFAFRNKYFYKSGFQWFIKKDRGSDITDRLAMHCVSLKAEDYLNMPALMENHIKVKMDEKERIVYAKAFHDLVYTYKDGTKEDIKNLVIKLQQLASGFYYETKTKKYEIVHTKMLDRLEEIIDTASSNVLLFYQFQADKDLITSRLKDIDVVELKTKESFENWNAGKIKVAMCHPRSVGYGMNLQSGGNTVLWYGYTWELDTHLQANARLYRQGQTKGVVVNYLYCENTIHEKIRTVLERKGNIQDLVRAVLVMVR